VTNRASFTEADWSLLVLLPLAACVLKASTLSPSEFWETVWNDGPGGGATGGGVSDTFGLPSWQAPAGVPGRAGNGHPGRGVPDVAGNAYSTYYQYDYYQYRSDSHQ